MKISIRFVAFVFILARSVASSATAAALVDDVDEVVDDEPAEVARRGLSKKRKRIIPVKGRPEGITEGRGENKILVSEMVDGRVLEYDVRTGKNKVIVSGSQAGARQAWGLELYKDVIFVASGGQKFGDGKEVRMYVYSAKTGKRIASCKPKWKVGFINDLTVLGGIAYVTDSYQNRLMVVDAEMARNGRCKVSALTLPPDFDVNGGAAEYAANGVVGFGPNHVLVAHELFGSVFAIDIRDKSGKTFRKITKDDDSTGPDGLAIRGNKLFVTQNIDNKVAVYNLKLSGRRKQRVQASKVGCLSSDKFRTIATSAVIGKKKGTWVYSTNSWLAETDFDPSAPLPEEDDIEAVIGVRLSAIGKCLD